MSRKIHWLLVTVMLQAMIFTVQSQHAESTVELKIRNPQFSYSAIDQKENYAFVFRSSSEMQFAFFTNTHQTNGNITISLPSSHRKDEVLGLQLKEDTCLVYLHNSRKMTVSMIQVNRTNGQHTIVPLAQLNYSDKFLKSVLVDHVFYVLTVPQGGNQIDVWTATPGTLDRTSYPITDMPDLYKRLSIRNDELNEETTSLVGIDLISYEFENNVKSAHASKKMYVYGGKIYMTFDDPEKTHLVELNLTTKTATYRQLQFTLDKGNASAKKQGNSFLFQNTLFRSTMSVDQLNVAVVRLDSLKLLANYNAYPGIHIDFKNGPILQEGSNDKFKIIEDNAVYFRKVLASQLSIAVNHKDSAYVMEVGGYEKYTSNNGYVPGGGPIISMGMGVGMGMGMGGFGYGGFPMGGYGMGMPGYYGGYPGYYPYNIYTTTIRTVYFHSMIDSASLEHKIGIVPITLRERVSNFHLAMFKDRDPELIQSIDRKNEIVIGFLLQNKSTFRTYSFSK